MRETSAMPEVEVSIVIPTFNELENVNILIKRISEVMGDAAWEIIFVDDDSPDGTSEYLRTRVHDDRRIRLLQRIGRRGLSSACVEGMLAASGVFVAVMDADLQHDETLLPKMLQALRRGEADLVVGSRYLSGGSTGEWSQNRLRISGIATGLAQRFLNISLSDPMSGFFMLTRDAIDNSVRGLSTIGFKILLDIVASSPPTMRVLELPYTFRPRQYGDSKLDSAVAWDYFMLLVDKMIGHVIPTRFVTFCLVGGAGVFVHMLVLSTGVDAVGADFVVSQAIATLVAMTFNYTINNILTYRDRRLRGWGFLRGWISFAAICGVGAVANIGIAGFLFRHNGYGWFLSGLAGIFVSTVWNFAVTSAYTWKKQPRRRAARERRVPQPQDAAMSGADAGRS